MKAKNFVIQLRIKSPLQVSKHIQNLVFNQGSFAEDCAGNVFTDIPFLVDLITSITNGTTFANETHT